MSTHTNYPAQATNGPRLRSSHLCVKGEPPECSACSHDITGFIYPALHTIQSIKSSNIKLGNQPVQFEYDGYDTMRKQRWVKLSLMQRLSSTILEREQIQVLSVNIVHINSVVPMDIVLSAVIAQIGIEKVSL